MLPEIFLSLSGVDAGFVESVRRQLPPGLAHLYTRSFESGENLLSAMEERADRASVFVLFASKQAVGSKAQGVKPSSWVGFELDRARLNMVQHTRFRLMVFPTDADVTHLDLPKWAQEHWMGRSGLSAGEIARSIRHVLSTPPFLDPSAFPTYGRGALTDLVAVQALGRLQDTGVSPNVFVLSGFDGIGRRTVWRDILAKAFPAQPELGAGPALVLNQFGDLADVYEALRQEIEDDFSVVRFRGDLEAFNARGEEEQVSEVVGSLEHIGSLGQAVTIVIGNGIFEDRGTLKPWARGLFKALSTRPGVVVCLATRRLMHHNELQPHVNVLQYHVDELADEHVRSIMTSTARHARKQMQLPSNSIISSIGGHPQVARAVAHLVLQQGATALDANPLEVFSLQEHYLAQSLDFDRLSDLKRDVLSVLSWVPRLNGALLADCFLARSDATPEEFGDTLADLARRCLVQASGPNYAMASPMRALFRRKHGYGSKDLLAAFANVLRAEWARAKAADRVPVELLDAVVFMTALEGKDLAHEFRSLLSPSTLLEVVRATYDRRDGVERQAFEHVVRWGALASGMTMDDGTREEILSFVVRSQSRLGDSSGAEETLGFIEARSYRSRHFLRGFHVRKSGGSLRKAVEHQREARRVRKYFRSVLYELGMCLYRLGEVEELQQLLDDEADERERSASLLDLQAALHIGAGRYADALVVLERMREMRDDDGVAASRMASLIMRRDGNYREAQRMLTTLVQRGGRGYQASRRLRAIAAAHAGDAATARADANFLRGQPDGVDTARRIEARVLMSQRAHDVALTELERVVFPTRHDALLRARILDGKSSDVRVPLSERQLAERQALVLRLKNKGVNDLDAV